MQLTKRIWLTYMQHAASQHKPGENIGFTTLNIIAPWISHWPTKASLVGCPAFANNPNSINVLRLHELLALAPNFPWGGAIDALWALKRRIWTLQQDSLQQEPIQRGPL